jgi:hypothetical protein
MARRQPCRTTADWPFDWVAEIAAIDPLTHSYTCIGTVRQAGTRRYDEALTNLRLMTRAPACTGSCKLSRACST